MVVEISAQQNNDVPASRSFRERILDINADAVADYLNAQIAAGAQAVQIFDTWGGMLADGDFQRFSLAATKKVVSRLTREADGAKVPVIVFTKGVVNGLRKLQLVGAMLLVSTGRQTLHELAALQKIVGPAREYGSSSAVWR